MDPASATAIAGVIVAIGSLAFSAFNVVFSVRRAEDEAIRSAVKDLIVHELQIEVESWRRRFDRVCEQAGVEPRKFITQPLGSLEVEVE